MEIKFHFREGRKKPFEARWYVHRKPKFKFFPTERERATWAKNFAKDLAKWGTASLASDPRRLARWEAAIQLLPPDADPFDVVNYYVTGHTGKSGLRLGEAIKDFLWHVQEQTASKERLTRYERTLNRLASIFPEDIFLPKITPAMIHRFIYSLDMSARSRRNHRSDVSAFFTHFVKLEEIPTNPVKGVPVPEFRSLEEPGTLSPEEVANLFLVNSDDPEACAMLALGCFAGMRSSAAGRVEFCDIRFTEKGLYTPAAKTKKARRQFLQGFPDNFWAWLERAPKSAFATEFPKTGSKADIEKWKTYNKRRFEHIRNRALRRAGLLVEALQARKTPGLTAKAPPHNWGRHSFVSYHVALYKDPGRTAYLVSHKDDPQQLYDAYLGERSETEAKAFFEIVPPLKP
jgi:site-specific recombinase XerC